MKNIEISTTQNVTIEYEFASLGERILAFFIDTIILFIMSILWNVFISITLGGFLDKDYFLTLFLTAFFPLMMYFLYFLLFEGFTGQTIGKKIVSIKVVRIDGQEPTLSDYAIRALFHLVDTVFSAGVLAITLVSTTDKRQRIGDIAANTCVVKLNPTSTFRLVDILTIDSLENYTPIYPQVTQLKEEDMLLVKSVLFRYQKHQNEAHSLAVINATNHLIEILNISTYPKDGTTFLNTILKDYIVLTR
jgi:uncharacterized RDD family membrane protein YckC